MGTLGLQFVNKKLAPKIVAAKTGCCQLLAKYSFVSALPFDLRVTRHFKSDKCWALVQSHLLPMLQIKLFSCPFKTKFHRCPKQSGHGCYFLLSKKPLFESFHNSLFLWFAASWSVLFCLLSNFHSFCSFRSILWKTRFHENEAMFDSKELFCSIFGSWRWWWSGGKRCYFKTWRAWVRSLA